MQAEHPENNPAGVYKAPIFLKYLTGLLIVMTLVGFFIMFTEFGRDYLWTTTIFLGLEALITLTILIQLADTVSVIIVSSIIFLASFLVEWWGTNTGFPFGFYSYTDILQPIVNGVPLAIAFAWYVVTSTSILAARYFLGNSSPLAAVAVSSVFILATDILLEPFATFANGFWSWDSGIIPMQNFAAWLLLGIVFSFTLNSLLKWKPGFKLQKQLLRIPLIIICINILNFSSVNIANGYLVLTLVGLFTFGIMIVSAKYLGNKAELI